MTAVVLVATTVNVDELPTVMEAGLAESVTVGGVLGSPFRWTAAQPVSTSKAANIENIETGRVVRLRKLRAQVFIAILLARKTGTKIQQQGKEDAVGESVLWRNGLIPMDTMWLLAA